MARPINGQNGEIVYLTSSTLEPTDHSSSEIARTLEGLMDEFIDVTRADKGFLSLMESNQMRVTAARATNS